MLNRRLFEAGHIQRDDETDEEFAVRVEHDWQVALRAMGTFLLTRDECERILNEGNATDYSILEEP